MPGTGRCTATPTCWPAIAAWPTTWSRKRSPRRTSPGANCATRPTPRPTPARRSPASPSPGGAGSTGRPSGRATTYRSNRPLPRTPPLTKTTDDGQPAPVAEPFTERRATYAIGSEIHFGSDVLSVAPSKINSFVQTDAGFVFTAVDQPGLFLADGKQVRRIGTGAGPGNFGELAAADHGNLVGWVEDFNGSSDSVVYDVAAGREVVRTALGNKRGPLTDVLQSPRIIAIDGGYAYLGTLQGVYRWNLETGEHQSIVDTVPKGVRDVSYAQYLYQRPLWHPTGGTGLAVGAKPGDSAGRDFPGQQGYLSPSAKYLLTATNDPQRISPPAADLRLFLTATGESLPLRHPDHPRLIFSQWLTDDTFTAVGVRATPKSPVDLLTCSTTSLSCQTTVPAFSTFTFTETPPRTTPFVLPIGTPIFWLYG